MNHTDKRRLLYALGGLAVSGAGVYFVLKKKGALEEAESEANTAPAQSHESEPRQAPQHRPEGAAVAPRGEPRPEAPAVGVVIPKDLLEPFQWVGQHTEEYARAQRDYEQYRLGNLALAPESYPFVWAVREDYEVIKTSPGRFVEVGPIPESLSVVLKQYLPSWASVKFVGLGAVILIAPEAAAALGVASEGVYVALKVTQLAYQIATVIRESANGTGAVVAEIAAQVFAAQGPGLALGLGEMVAHYLKTWGVRVAVKSTVSPFVD